MKMAWSGPFDMIFDFFIQGFSRENGLERGLMSGKLYALSIGNTFKSNEGWSGLERILLIPKHIHLNIDK